jgi:hypothetical protein
MLWRTHELLTQLHIALARSLCASRSLVHQAIVRFCATPEGEGAEATRIVGIEVKNLGMVTRLLESATPVSTHFALYRSHPS